MTAPLYIDHELESDFTLKLVHFKKYFASKCTPIENDSSLPSTLEFYSQFMILSLNVIEDDTMKTVRAHDINKAHDHDEISGRMIKYVMTHL